MAASLDLRPRERVADVDVTERVGQSLLKGSVVLERGAGLTNLDLPAMGA
jgi:hypothetical protein